MARKPPEKPKLFEPWAPPAHDIVDVAAIKALFAGTATADQQRHAMHFILVNLCGVDDEPFCPTEDGRRSTDYALGKRRVALFLRSLLYADIQNYRSPGAAPSEQP